MPYTGLTIHRVVFRTPMSIARSLAALLIGLLIGLGGLGGHGAHMAMAAQAVQAPAMDMMDVQSGMHAAHHHDGHATPDHSSPKQTMPSCCLFACGLLTVLPAPVFAVSQVGWATVQLLPPSDDGMGGRSVSPLRRPPRSLA